MTDVSFEPAATTSFVAEQPFLLLPVRVGATVRRVSVRVNGVRVREFAIELAEGEPDWWTFVDLAPFSGESVTVGVDGGEAAAALNAVRQSDRIDGAEPLYRESRRPQLRFSARRGWVNDPNGLVFFDGEYHLFFQHDPYGWTGRNMHWGHAVSTDLVHWTELPLALYPDESGPVYSGTAVVDWADTAGFQDGPSPALIAIYTAAGKPHTQGIAASTDRGRTWRKYAGNPVIPALSFWNRDPKVFWHAPEGRDGKWVMALYLDRMNPDELGEITMDVVQSFRRSNVYGLFSSPDLKRWEKMSEISLPEDGECPELFEIAVEGAPGESRWIFSGASGRYLVGFFDGTGFTVESGPHTLHLGDCGYAGQTFNEIPASDGRRILIAWGMTPQWGGPVTDRGPVFEGMPFNQSMSLPVELTLRATPDGLRLFANPVAELAGLRRETTRFGSRPLSPDENPITMANGELFEIETDIAVGTASRIVLRVRGVPVVFDVRASQLSCLEKTAPLEVVDGRIRLRVYADRTNLDVFANDGRVFMPMSIDLTSREPGFSASAEGGEATVLSLDVHELASIWS